ncbi:MAG: nickel pincer cofactor biosynthesis protein LarB [Pseudomonadota bacterium]
MDRTAYIQDLARLDLDRKKRSGIPEVVFGEGKTFDQVVTLTRSLAESTGRAMVTRLQENWLEKLGPTLSPLVVEMNTRGRLAVVRKEDSVIESNMGAIGLLSAGTADIPIAEEARVVAQEMGCEVIAHFDVGVAGIHRLVKPLEEFFQKQVSAVVVVAGMDGTLPTLVKSLIPVPVIGVPTSVGYGYGRAGEAALMTMLHSCVPGLTVVNIDNGFGGGATAALIANQTARAKES